MIPNPLTRPDYEYWTSDRKYRNSLSEMELKVISKLLTQYHNKRFAINRKFKMTKALWGIGEGCVGVIIETHPSIIISFEYAKATINLAISFKLDVNLEVV